MKNFNIFFLIFMIFFSYSGTDDFKNAISIRSEPSQYRYYLNNMDGEYLSKFKRDFNFCNISNMNAEQENNFLFFLRQQASVILMAYSKKDQFRAIMNIFAALNYKKHCYSKHNAFFLIKYKRCRVYREMTLKSISEFNGKKIFLTGVEDYEKKGILNVKLSIYEETIRAPSKILFKMKYGIEGDLDLVKYKIEDFDLPFNATYYDIVSFFLNDKYFLSFDNKAKLLEYWIDQEQINVKIQNTNDCSYIKLFSHK